MANRKLFADVERTLKKCTEGMDNFDDIEERLNESTISNQRDKLESDLKKEIKKLQKYRETIKQWLNNDNIKDKSQLKKMRKNIEIRMELFKKCEKQTKTKAYSKEALNKIKKSQLNNKLSKNNNNNNNKIIYSHKENEAIQWFTTQKIAIETEINLLNELRDKYEIILSKINKKHYKTKNNDKISDELNKMRDLCDKAKWHLNKLNFCANKILNKKIESELYKNIREDVEYYIEVLRDTIANKTFDDHDDNQYIYMHGYDDMYDIFNKDTTVINTPPTPPTQSPIQQPQPTTLPITITPKNINQNKNKNKNKQKQKNKKKNKNKNKNKDINININLKRRNKSNKPKNSPSVSSVNSYRSDLSIKSNQSNPQQSGTNTNIQNQHLSTMRLPPQSNHKDNNNKNISQQLLQQPLNVRKNKYIKIKNNNNNNNNNRDDNNALTNGNIHHHNNNKTHSNTHVKTHNNNSNTPQRPVIPPQLHNRSNNPSYNSDTNSTSSTSLRKPPKPRNSYTHNTHNGNAPPMTRTTSTPSTITTTLPSSVYPTRSVDAILNNNNNKDNDNKSNVSNNSNSLPPFSRTLTYSEKQILNIIQLGYNQRPRPLDTFEPSFYKPDNPFSTPSYFPSERKKIFDDKNIYTLMELDTLFFIFYYQQQSYQQYLAARELKTRGWSFNTKYSAWFQRHYSKTKQKQNKDDIDDDIDNNNNNNNNDDIDNKNGIKSLSGKGQHIITDGKYERGTYIFFDRNQSWQMRIKQNFKFEYQYLEDDKNVNVDDKLDWNKLVTYGNGCGLIYGEQKQILRQQQQSQSQSQSQSQHHQHQHQYSNKYHHHNINKSKQISQIQSKSRQQQQQQTQYNHIKRQQTSSNTNTNNQQTPTRQYNTNTSTRHNLNTNISNNNNVSSSTTPPTSSVRRRYPTNTHPTRPPTSYHAQNNLNIINNSNNNNNNNNNNNSASSTQQQQRFRPPIRHGQQFQSSNTGNTNNVNTNRYQSRR